MRALRFVVGMVVATALLSLFVAGWIVLLFPPEIRP